MSVDKRRSGGDVESLQIETPLASSIAAATNPRALKLKLGSDLLRRVSASITGVFPTFNEKDFLGILPELDLLEMKPRVHRIRDELRHQLPSVYPDALEVLIKSAIDPRLESFDFWAYTEFVQTYGLDYPDLSLAALRELTKVFTSEWAVRPFIKRYPEKALKFLLQCASDKDVNVRRWASEGARPRLPWGEQLHEFVQDPRPTFLILEHLKFDPELFVRKSVANHLNDIAKDHPEVVIETLTRWKRQAATEDIAKVEWIIRHTLRTLIKGGHPAALGLLGVKKAQIKFGELELVTDCVNVGERLDFAFMISSTSPNEQQLVIDYLIHFVRSNGTTTPKVFKLKTMMLPVGGVLRLHKVHDLKRITTREYYAGLHNLEIQINGEVVGSRTWTLSTEKQTG